MLAAICKMSARLYSAGLIRNNSFKNTVSRQQACERSEGREIISVFHNGLKSNRRRASTLEHDYSISTTDRNISFKDESKEFAAVFSDIVKDLTAAINTIKCNEAVRWFEKAVQYNVPHGKKNRGILTVLAYKNLVSEKQVSPDQLKLAKYLGWCVEFLHGYFLICDDIMDMGTFRRGQPCWYRVPDVGFVALNDALMLESAVYILLEQHFQHLDCYTNLLKLFHQMTFAAISGQCLDLLSSKKDVSAYTMDLYNSIVTNKTSEYTFYMPFALAMHLAGIKDAEVFRQSKSVLLEMGHFFQVQDDFIDCFGQPEITGKVGTDIQDKKCSWLAVKCMEFATKEQKTLMADCYGQNDPAKVERVKQLYRDLNLPNIYAKYEEDSYNAIKSNIQQMSAKVPRAIFFAILDKIYQRTS